MASRYVFLEKIIRQVYGEQPSDDSSITFNLANVWLSEAIAAAAKKNYTDSLSLDGIAYVNNSFYATYKDLAIVLDRQLVYKITLPEIPIGIGRNEGVSSLQIKYGNGYSYDCIPLSVAQVGYVDGMMPIPNRLLYWTEGNFIYVKTSVQLYQHTALVRMISGGNSSDLDSVLNVPSDYLAFITDYVMKSLMIGKQVPKDLVNDGVDN
jgi:hypothetical protein